MRVHPRVGLVRHVTAEAEGVPIGTHVRGVVCRVRIVANQTLPGFIRLMENRVLAEFMALGA